MDNFRAYLLEDRTVVTPAIKPQTVYFPRVKVFGKAEQPKYYVGSKLFIYNKYILLMMYSQAFYFEEAIFNLYKVCKTFRTMLIKNYKCI